MAHISIFLDESGDLGSDLSKKMTSKYFVINILICWDLKTLDSFSYAVNRTLKKKINYKKKQKSLQEIKAFKTAVEVKKYFYNQLPEEGWSIYSYVLDKEKVLKYLQAPKNKHKLYNFISGKLLGNIHFSEEIKTINLVVDRSKAPREILEFDEYLRNQLEAKMPLNAILNINHQLSELSPGIQAVDLFSWGIYRKYSKNDVEWYEMFKKHIVFEEIYEK